MCRAWQLTCSGRHCGSKRNLVIAPCQSLRRIIGCKIRYDEPPDDVQFTCRRCRGGFYTSYVIEMPQTLKDELKLEPQPLAPLGNRPGYYECFSTTVTHIDLKRRKGKKRLKAGDGREDDGDEPQDGDEVDLGREIPEQGKEASPAPAPARAPTPELPPAPGAPDIIVVDPPLDPSSPPAQAADAYFADLALGGAGGLAAPRIPAAGSQASSRYPDLPSSRGTTRVSAGDEREDHRSLSDTQRQYAVDPPAHYELPSRRRR